MIQVVFCGKSHFEDDGTQNSHTFQPMYRYFKRIGNTDHISEWKFKGLSDEIIKLPAISGNSLAPALSYFGNKTRLKFAGNCLKEDKVTFTHGKNSTYLHCSWNKFMEVCILY